MTINELSQYYYLSKEIQKDKCRIVELRSKAEKITVSTLGFPLSKTENSKVEKGVIAIAAIEAEARKVGLTYGNYMRLKGATNNEH